MATWPCLSTTGTAARRTTQWWTWGATSTGVGCSRGDAGRCITAGNSSERGGRPPLPSVTPLGDSQPQNVPVSARSVFCAEVGDETVGVRGYGPTHQFRFVTGEISIDISAPRRNGVRTSAYLPVEWVSLMDRTVRRRATGRCQVGPRETVRRGVRRRRLGIHGAGGYPQRPGHLCDVPTCSGTATVAHRTLSPTQHHGR